MTKNDFLAKRDVLFLVIRYALKSFFRVLNKYFLNKQMSVIVRKIMKYHMYKLRYSVVTVTLRMCCSSKSVCQVATGKVFVRGTSNAAMQVDMGEPPLQRLCDIMVRSL